MGYFERKEKEHQVALVHAVVALRRASLRLNEHSDYVEARHANRRAEELSDLFHIDVSVDGEDLFDSE